MQQNQEAKINENMSKVQLELNKLDTQYQIDNEADPTKNLDQYREARKQIFDTYGEQISPLYSRIWQENVNKIAAQNDAQQQGWVLKQTRVNTVNSINRSMKDSLSLASMNGQNFGNSDQTEIGAFLDYQNSRSQLAGFGNKHLGAETTTQMLDGYEDDYMKSFLSGVSETNPVKALKLMDQDVVKNSFKDQRQFLEMKQHIENRAFNADDIFAKKQVLGALKGENSLLARSLEEPIGYTQLNVEMDRLNLSAKARNYFLSANGYTKRGEGVTLTDEQKGELKEKLFNNIINMGKGDKDITPEQIQKMQADVYDAAQKGALTPTETAQWVNNVMNPYIAQKEETIGKFSDNGWFADDLGLRGLQEAFDEKIAIVPAEGEKKLGVMSQRANLRNKVRMYDTYMAKLSQAAQSRNIPVGDIQKLDRDTRRQIYSQAQTDAIKSFNAENYPELANQKDTPNSVIPVIQNPSDLQETYEKVGGGAITREQIMDAARNKKVSPQTVIDALRQQGKIK